MDLQGRCIGVGPTRQPGMGRAARRGLRLLCSGPGAFGPAGPFLTPIGRWNALGCTNGQRGKHGLSDCQGNLSENRNKQKTHNTIPFIVWLVKYVIRYLQVD